MENKKCPRCSYPLEKVKDILLCKNCKLFIHERDIFFPNEKRKAVFERSLIN